MKNEEFQKNFNQLETKVGKITWYSV
jgi:hypothetical protein